MTKIDGTKYDDDLRGGVTADILNGFGGDDILIGNGGVDSYFGGDGYDAIFIYNNENPSDRSRSIAYGGADDDTIQVYVGSMEAYGGEGNDFFRTNGADSIFGGSGVDTLDLTMFNGVDFTLAANGAGRIAATSTRYASIESVLGSDFNDVLRGNTADNFLSGADGSDLLIGSAGDDALNGNSGRDTLTGGRGGDAFVFSDYGSRDNDRPTSADFISDFDASQDRLVFASDAFKGLQTGSDTADGTMVGHSIFALLASEFVVQTTRHAATVGVRIIYDSDDGLIYYDPDGALSGYRSTIIADIGTGHALTAGDIFIF